MTYVISGEPLPLRDFKLISRSVWSDYKEEQIIRALQLENQHNDRPIIGGALKINFVFSFDVTKGRSRKITNKHTQRPCIEDLIRYINVLARDRVYIPESIVAVTACKQFSAHPCTEFTIEELI